MDIPLRAIAEVVNGTLVGDPEATIRAIRGIEEAGEGDLTFVANRKYKKKLATTKATAILVSRDTVCPGKNLIRVDDPYVAFGKVLALLYPEEAVPRGISDRAWLSADAQVDPEATVYPFVYIGSRTRVGRGVVLYPGVFLDHDVVVGADTILYPNVTVYRRSIIGERVIVHAGVVIGSDGFGFARPGWENIKIPQTGFVQIDDDVEIGANTTIDRGTIGKTWIKKGAKIDNLVQIAHNVTIGEKAMIVSQVGIAGSTKIGDRVLIGGQAGLVGHIHIGDGSMIAARSGIHEDVPPGRIVAGAPHQDHRDWLRTAATIPRLPEMRAAIVDLKKKITEIEFLLKERQA
ncbi:MAG: UDP-3-O-(3-hydroxymyristoyl)glucosamine N-acyltransferase [Syntrophales bacterium]|nr:UDP-3-O-(3-hydroxymyristoyl)glucosamine N-acyltransferase [Syntrophales bacterium]